MMSSAPVCEDIKSLYVYDAAGSGSEFVFPVACSVFQTESPSQRVNSMKDASLHANSSTDPAEISEESYQSELEHFAVHSPRVDPSVTLQNMKTDSYESFAKDYILNANRTESRRKELEDFWDRLAATWVCIEQERLRVLIERSISIAQDEVNNMPRPDLYTDLTESAAIVIQTHIRALADIHAFHARRQKKMQFNSKK
jgi:hypothetical protein